MTPGARYRRDVSSSQNLLESEGFRRLLKSRVWSSIFFLRCLPLTWHDLPDFLFSRATRSFTTAEAAGSRRCLLLASLSSRALMVVDRR